MLNQPADATHWKRYAADLATVLHLSQGLAGGIHRLDKLLHDVTDAAKSLSGADRCSLFLINHEHGFLWTSVAHGSGTITVPMGVGIVGAVAKEGKTINIPDAYVDERFDRSIDQRTGYRTQSILSLPMVDHEGQTVGVLQALNKQVAQDDKPLEESLAVVTRAFDHYDEELLSALCGQAAVAVVNAQLIETDRQHQKLRRDLELARSIQEALQPQTLPDNKHWRFAAWQQSCDDVGGDFYDFLPADDAVDAILADVSGHGISAALVVNTARSFIRALHLSVANNTMLNRVNALLEQDLGDDSFLTLCMTRFYGDGRIDMVSCGHEPPFIYRKQVNRFDSVEPGGLILGALDGVEYDIDHIQALSPGDIVLMTTDGFFEAEQVGGDPEQWGVERMRESVRMHASRNLSDMVRGVVADAVVWRGGSSFEDDITIIAAEYLGP